MIVFNLIILGIVILLIVIVRMLIRNDDFKNKVCKLFNISPERLSSYLPTTNNLMLDTKTYANRIIDWMISNKMDTNPENVLNVIKKLTPKETL